MSALRSTLDVAMERADSYDPWKDAEFLGYDSKGNYVYLREDGVEVHTNLRMNGVPKLTPAQEEAERRMLAGCVYRINLEPVPTAYIGETP